MIYALFILPVSLIALAAYLSIRGESGFIDDGHF